MFRWLEFIFRISKQKLIISHNKEVQIVSLHPIGGLARFSLFFWKEVLYYLTLVVGPHSRSNWRQMFSKLVSEKTMWTLMLEDSKARFNYSNINVMNINFVIWNLLEKKVLITCSAHQTTNFRNSEYQFPHLRCCKVFSFFLM